MFKRRNSQTMNKGMRWLITGLTMLLLLLLPFNVLAASLGMGPPSIEISDALPGHEYEATIFVQYSDSDECTLKLSAIGDISGWVSFYEQGNLANATERVIAPVAEWVYITVKFIIPRDASIGTTSGTLIAKTVTPEAESGMSVSLKGSVNVVIDVVGKTEERTTTSPIPAEEAPADTFTYVEGESTLTDIEGDPTGDNTALITYSIVGVGVVALVIGIVAISRRKLLRRR